MPFNEIKMREKEYCCNCGEELPEYDIIMVVYCSACQMRNDQLIENWQRELKLFGELRRKIREKKRG